MEYQVDIPIYLQIMKDIKMKVVSGKWKAGMRVASVRDLAVEYQVNPNTMQRALAEMEREGLMATNRTKGRLVTWDDVRIAREQEKMAEKVVQDFLEVMALMGFSQEKTIEWVAREVQKNQSFENRR